MPGGPLKLKRVATVMAQSSAPLSLHLAEGVADSAVTEAQATLKAAGLELVVVRTPPGTDAVLNVSAGVFTGATATETLHPVLQQAALAIWRAQPALSIVGDYAQGLRFNLLIGTGEAENAIAAFLRLIDDLVHDRVSEDDCKTLLTWLPVGGTVLVTYDAAAGKIVPVKAGAGAEPVH